MSWARCREKLPRCYGNYRRPGASCSVNRESRRGGTARLVSPLYQKLMALKAIIYKANLQLSDIDRNVYGDHQVTIARHPSETDERMMIRLLAFALNMPASDENGALEFAKDMW